MGKTINALPSIITLINLICGFMAVVIGDIKVGIFLVVAGAFADVFDGLVARILDVESEMGKELDSLADIVTFGVAPAYLYYLIAPQKDLYHALAVALFVAGGALRLAKFNTSAPSKYFRGLPIPAAAMFLIGILYGFLKESSIILAIVNNYWLYLSIPLILGILMNSNLTMFSFKSIQKDIASNFFPVLLIVMMMLFFLIDHKIAIPLTIISYVILSYISGLISRSQKQ